MLASMVVLPEASFHVNSQYVGKAWSPTICVPSQAVPTGVAVDVEFPPAEVIGPEGQTATIACA